MSMTLTKFLEGENETFGNDYPGEDKRRLPYWIRRMVERAWEGGRKIGKTQERRKIGREWEKWRDYVRKHGDGPL